MSSLTVTSYELRPLRCTPAHVDPEWSGPRDDKGGAGEKDSLERSGSVCGGHAKAAASGMVAAVLVVGER